MSASKIITYIVVSLAGAIFLFGTFIVLMVMMLPTVVAFFVDRSPKKYLARCVGSINVCGTLPGLLDLWLQGQTVAAAGAILSDVFYWLYAYGAAALGWALFTGVPSLIASYVSVKAQRRVAEMRAKQQKLVEEWGEEVAREVRGSGVDPDMFNEDTKKLEGGGGQKALPPEMPKSGGDTADLPAFDDVDQPASL